MCIVLRASHNYLGYPSSIFNICWTEIQIWFWISVITVRKFILFTFSPFLYCQNFCLWRCVVVCRKVKHVGCLKLWPGVLWKKRFKEWMIAFNWFCQWSRFTAYFFFYNLHLANGFLCVKLADGISDLFLPLIGVLYTSSFFLSLDDGVRKFLKKLDFLSCRHMNDLVSKCKPPYTAVVLHRVIRDPLFSTFLKEGT